MTRLEKVEKVKRSKLQSGRTAPNPPQSPAFFIEADRNMDLFWSDLFLKYLVDRLKI